MKVVICISSVLLFGLKSFAQERHSIDSLISISNQSKNGTQRIDALLKLAQFQIFKPGENQTDFDSAIAYMKEAERLNASLKSKAVTGYRILTEAFMVREKGKGEEAKKMMEKSVSILEQGDNKNYLGKAYFELSNFYNYRDSTELTTRIGLVEKSIIAYEEAGNTQDKAFSLVMAGDLYAIFRNFPKAVESLEKALAAYRSINYRELQSVYDILARIYRNGYNDYKLALQYELLALRSAQLTKDSSMLLVTINNTLASIYRDIGRKELAIPYYKSALETALKYNDSHGMALVIYNLTGCMHDLGQSRHALDFMSTLPSRALEYAGPFETAYIALSYMKSYLGTGQVGLASKYATRLVPLAESDEIPLEVRNYIYLALATYYFVTKNYSLTRAYLIKNAPFSENLPGSSKRIANDTRLWYKLDSSQGNYKAAFYHLLTYKEISDSLFNEIKSRQLQQLEVEFEIEKKQDSLKAKDRDILLLMQTNDLQQENLRQADLIKNITFTGIILAIVIIALLYRQYRQKQKSNAIIFEKNGQLEHLVSEKEWLLKEVHHRVKNSLQTVVSILELQSGYLNQDALATIQASRNRIYATSLLHQKLYQDENVSSVDMSAYIPELIHYLKDAYAIRQQIDFRIRVSTVELDVSQAVPVGLIINECITNAIKYAFLSPQHSPEISLSFDINHNGMAELIIIDNGNGFTIVDQTEHEGLGLKLVKGLAQDIDGIAKIESSGPDKGTRIFVSFPIKQPLSIARSIPNS